MNRSSRICLLGSSLDNPNRGVCALAASFFGLAARIRPDAQLFSLYGNRTSGQTLLQLPEGTVSVSIVNFRQSIRSSFRVHILWILLMASLYRLLPFRKIRRTICRTTPWIDALDKADFIGEVRGGDSFSDLYGLRKFFAGILPTLTPLIMGKDLVFLPQTFIPFRSKICRIVARAIVSRAKEIYARDKNSLDNIKRLVGDRGNIHFCPDMAFSLPLSPAPDSSIQPPLPAEKTRIVGININGMLVAAHRKKGHSFGFRIDYLKLVTDLIRAILEHTDSHVLLVPHVFSGQTQDDMQPSRTICENIQPIANGRLHLVSEPLNERQLKSIIGKCDYFIGSRMHSCIAALSQGIPCSAIAYSDKFAGVFETVGYADHVLDASTMEPTRLIESIIKDMKHMGCDSALAARSEEAKAMLLSVFCGMLSRKKETVGCSAMQERQEA